MVRKCRRIAEITVMEVAEVGVRTRAQAAMEIDAARSRSTKRRKVGNGESTVSLTPDFQLRDRKRLVKAEVNSFAVTRSPERNSASSPCSDPISDQAPASCCSSNCFAELDDDIVDFAELEAVRADDEVCINNDGNERREATPTGQISPENMSNNVESTVGQTDSTSRRGLIPSKTPFESEIEGFFSSAEEDLRKSFAEKYNYDIVKDEPLEGRYEWARLKP